MKAIADAKRVPDWHGSRSHCLRHVVSVVVAVTAAAAAADWLRSRCITCRAGITNDPHVRTVVIRIINIVVVAAKPDGTRDYKGLASAGWLGHSSFGATKIYVQHHHRQTCNMLSLMFLKVYCVFYC